VRLNGRIYEALAARLQRRPPRDLYHSALQVELPEGAFVIEQAPVHDWSGDGRGVVAEGAVGARWAGRFRIFRYEIRLWRGGRIPDVAEAVDSPRRLGDQEQFARRVLEVAPQVPTPVWGRDELGTGEMWNSNSVIAWVIARSGIDAESIQPPQGGRAPGWRAGVIVAQKTDTEGTVTANPYEQSTIDRQSAAISRSAAFPLKDGSAMTAGEIAAATGLARATVSTTLSRLARSSEVTKAARGYQIAPESDAAAVDGAGETGTPTDPGVV
jgi:hypothetical protein